MSWEKVKLADLYDVHNGLAKGSKFFGSGYPFLSFSTIFNNYFIPDSLPDLVFTTDSERNNFSIKIGDVFVTRTSETADELGMSCVALKDYPNATYNGFTKRLRPKTNRVAPLYIGYYMRMPSFRAKFRAFSTMTTRASLRNEDLLSLEVLLPSISVQNKIANILYQYDLSIENNQKQIKLLEEAAQRLYKEWFVDFRFPGHENTTFVDGLPEGWSSTNLSSICIFKRGKTITKNETQIGSVPVVAGGLEPAYYHNVANTKAPVITVSGSGANAGFSRMYFKEVFASDCSYADSDTTNYIYFVYGYLKDCKGLLDSLQKGSAQPHVYAKDINNLPLLLPPDEITNNYCKLVKPIFEKERSLLSQIKNLTEARDRLLPKLMNGEIEV